MTPGKINTIGFSKASATFRLIDDPPMELRRTAGTIPFPINLTKDRQNWNAWSKIDESMFHVTYISQGEKKQAVKFNVLEIRNGFKDSSEIDQTLVIGDAFSLQGTKFRLMNIVPPNPDEKLQGWIELNQEPEPDTKADAAKDKVE